MKDFFVSICIPSYNRPNELLRLLQSVDCGYEDEVQIVICEDKSPKRTEIRDVVSRFKNESRYEIKYVENETNKGYDGNIRSFTDEADGEYVILMGDDDIFLPNTLDDYISFLKEHRELGYVLRSYQKVHISGAVERYIYYDGIKFFDAGPEAYCELFRKSVFVSGFTFKREWATDIKTDRFDGTLLYQLYIQAEICLNHPSAYYNVPFTCMYEGGEFYFGSSEAEKKLYTPNKHTVEGEVNFISSFFKITRYIDSKYGIDSTKTVMTDMSKYSFPILALISENGRSDLKAYYRELKKLGFGCTKYFGFYYVALLVFGPKICRKVIILIKKMLGKTPKL